MVAAHFNSHMINPSMANIMLSLQNLEDTGATKQELYLDSSNLIVNVTEFMKVEKANLGCSVLVEL